MIALQQVNGIILHTLPGISLRWINRPGNHRRRLR
jgi:hypothetical protein